MAAKRQKMTVREKKFRAEVRAQLRAEGAIPPTKKPLNRKKFIEEAVSEYNTTMTLLADHGYLFQAFGLMTGTYRPTLENVGAAKVLKIACALKSYHEGRSEPGTIGERYEYIKPILDA